LSQELTARAGTCGKSGRMPLALKAASRKPAVARRLKFQPICWKAEGWIDPET
jgi:hypothetical protein